MKKIFTLALVLLSLSSFALTPTDFTVQRITSPYFVVDGNSPTSGPLSAYVGFKITNTSSTVTYTNLKFTITSIGTSVVGQNYTLVSPASGVTSVGTLAPGATKVCYFYVSYPGSTTAQATFNYTLSDLTASSKTGNFVITNRSCISANAGGIATQSISSQDLIGGTVNDDVTYTLGNIKSGDENDFQVSVSTQFDPTKLLLLSTQVVSSSIPGITANTNDLLYFIASANSSGTVTIRFTFKISSSNFTTYVLPYAGSTSGSTNYKYAINTSLGSGTAITIPSTANPLIITKTSDQTLYGYNNTATFTVTIQNPGIYPVSIDKITDEIPTNFTFQSIAASSQVTAANSTAYPVAGATGTISFEGGVVSGSNTSFTVPAGGSLILKYTATAPALSLNNLLTTARGYVGVNPFGSATNTVGVSGVLPITLQAFTATHADEKVKLNWTTASELNSAYFEVQRSEAATPFVSIDRVEAIGKAAHYTFLDSFPLAVKAYYRLRMVDKDGSYKYSPVALVDAITTAPSVSILNPFTSTLKAQISLPEKENVVLKLFDGHGQLIRQKSVDGSEGINTVELDASGIAKGMYYLQFQIGNKTIVREAVKE